MNELICYSNEVSSTGSLLVGLSVQLDRKLGQQNMSLCVYNNGLSLGTGLKCNHMLSKGTVRFLVLGPDLPEGCDSKVTVVLSPGQNKDMQCGRATRGEVNYQ